MTFKFHRDAFAVTFKALEMDMTEQVFLQQLYILKMDIETCLMIDSHAAQMREQWARRLNYLTMLRIDAVKTAAETPLTTEDQRVTDVMGSAPECAANGCQFRKTAGYAPGQKADFTS